MYCICSCIMSQTFCRFYLDRLGIITSYYNQITRNDSKNYEKTNEASTSVPRPLMPNVICLTLQKAQDLIQDQGVFLSRSEDATGQNRNQLVDSNWIVIEQNLKPGEQFSEGDAVLQVLKEVEAKDRGLCQ